MPEVGPQDGDGVLTDHGDVAGQVDWDSPGVHCADSRRSDHTGGTCMVRVNVLKNDPILHYDL